MKCLSYLYLSLQQNLTIIVFLSEIPMETTHGVTVEKIRTLNAAARKLIANSYQDRVLLFDAFLPLQARYNELCKKYNFPNRRTRKWICTDKMHAGAIINDHYAQMLLNQVCQS